VLFQLGLVAADLLGRPALLGDVGVHGDEALVRQRKAADRQDAPVGPDALGGVGLEAPRPGHPLGDLLRRIAGAVVTALGVEADEVLEGYTRPGEGFGEIQQAQEGRVPGDHPQLGVEHREALVEQIQPGAQHFR
jgi:hypothetical protein